MKTFKVVSSTLTFDQALEIAFYRLNGVNSTVIKTEFGSILIEKKLTKNTDALPEVWEYKSFDGNKYSQVYIKYRNDSIDFYAQIPSRVINSKKLILMDLEFILLKAMILNTSKHYLTLNNEQVTDIALGVYFDLHQYDAKSNFKERFYTRYLTTIFNEDKNKLMFEMYFDQIDRCVIKYKEILNGNRSILTNIDRIVNFPMTDDPYDDSIDVYYSVLTYILANVITSKMNPYNAGKVYNASMEVLRNINYDNCNSDSNTEIVAIKTAYQYMKYVLRKFNKLMNKEDKKQQ